MWFVVNFFFCNCGFRSFLISFHCAGDSWEAHFACICRLWFTFFTWFWFSHKFLISLFSFTYNGMNVCIVWLLRTLRVTCTFVLTRIGRLYKWLLFLNMFSALSAFSTFLWLGTLEYFWVCFGLTRYAQCKVFCLESSLQLFRVATVVIITTFQFQTGLRTGILIHDYVGDMSNNSCCFVVSHTSTQWLPRAQELVEALQLLFRNLRKKQKSEEETKLEIMVSMADRLYIFLPNFLSPPH